VGKKGSRKKKKKLIGFIAFIGLIKKSGRSPDKRHIGRLE
jgi:hypothetical protein